jgi:hypothetical protein
MNASKIATDYQIIAAASLLEDASYEVLRLLYERPEAQCVGCNTRAFNHQITCLLLSAYMAGSYRLCSPVHAVCSTWLTGGYQCFT